MKLRVSNIFLSVAIVCFAMAIFFLASAKMAHMTCCNKEWVDSAPNAETHVARLHARTWALSEVAKVRKESFVYALVSLLAGAAFLLLFYRRRKLHPVRRKLRYEITTPPPEP
jgi:hypothetical protein